MFSFSMMEMYRNIGLINSDKDVAVGFVSSGILSDSAFSGMAAQSARKKENIQSWSKARKSLPRSYPE